MKLRTPLDVWRLTLLSTVGLSATAACGGQVETTSGSDALMAGGDPPATTTGTMPSGSTTGNSTSQGSMATGSGGDDPGTSMPTNGGGSTSATGTSTGRGPGGAPATGSGGASTTGGAVAIGGAPVVGVGGFLATGGEVTGAKGGEGGATVGAKGCDAAVALDGGFESCGQGYLHRPTAVACVEKPRDTECSFASLAENPACTTDADCTASPFGHCEPGEQIADCFCSYGCLEDSDCGAGQVCLCGDPVGSCIPATCTTDADCEEDSLCASTSNGLGTGPGAFQCQSDHDECSSDADCATGVCGTDGTKRICQPMIAIGRPFLVDGQQRLAGMQRRYDWREAVDDVRTDHLSPSERQALADHFTTIAQMEHASIAAFARFSLQLLSLGAPATLVEQATMAMADETRHAKLAFELASVFGDASIGPASLELDGALTESSLEEIALTTVIEGCIGETVAAVEAREVAAHVQDVALRQVFEDIADDETQHSKLAWQFLKWAIHRAGPSLARRALQLIEQAARDAAATTATETSLAESHDWLRLGLVTDAARGDIRRQVLADVVLPCAHQLLGSHLRSSDAPAS